MKSSTLHALSRSPGILALALLLVARVQGGPHWFSGPRAESGTYLLTQSDLEAAARDEGSTVFDIVISLYNNPQTNEEKEPYEEIVRYFADGVYESTNGAHKLGTVRFYRNSRFADRADIVWGERGHPATRPSGYGHGFNLLGTNIFAINMFDVFEYTPPFLEDPFAAPIEQANFIVEQEYGGYTLAHEWGHNAYGLYDEYAVSQLLHTFAALDGESIMKQQKYAVGWPSSGSLLNLNFSIDADYTPPKPRDTAQFAKYGASCWTTLSRDTSLDPVTLMFSVHGRTHWTDLDAVAPQGDEYPRFDLPGTAQSEFIPLWPSEDLAYQVVIDRSGSMAGSPLENAKLAAQLLVDRAEIGTTTIGVIAFDNAVTTVFPLTPIDSYATKVAVRDAIAGIQSGGSTAIGEGAATALQALQVHPDSAAEKVVFLLSDGESNSGRDPLSVIPDYQQAQVPIFAFAYGSNADTTTLSALAQGTRGRFYVSPTTAAEITTAFQDAQNQVSSSAALLGGTGNAPAAGGFSTPFVVDSTLDELFATVSYTGTPSDADITLVSPSGNSHTPSSCDQSGGETICSFQVGGPALEVGEWDLLAASLGGPLELAYSIAGTPGDEGTSVLVVESVLGSSVRYPEPIVLIAAIKRTHAIAGASLEVEVKSPSGVIQSIPIHDDGREPDALASDGVWSAFVPYDTDGAWTINVSGFAEAGQAAYTQLGFETPDTNGHQVPSQPNIPIPESITRHASLQVSVSGYRSDDHGNMAASATMLDPNGVDVPGRIDYGGDLDVFAITGADSRATETLYVARLFGISGGMTPSMRILADDGMTVLSELGIPDVEAAPSHIVLPLPLAPGARLYAEVRHMEADGTGNYYVSAGPILSGEVASGAVASLLYMNRWNLKLDPKAPGKGTLIFEGWINDPEGSFVPQRDGMQFLFNGSILAEIPASGLTRKRGSKYVYRTNDLSATVWHREGGTSRSRFSVSVRGNLEVLRGSAAIATSVASGSVADAISFVAELKGPGGRRGAIFTAQHQDYSSEELYTHSLRAKRHTGETNKDSVRVEAQVVGGPVFSPTTDTLDLNLGFLGLVIPPGGWTVRGEVLAASGSLGGDSRYMVRLDRRTGAISLSAVRLTLDSELSSVQTIRVAYGTFNRSSRVEGVVQRDGSRERLLY